MERRKFLGQSILGIGLASALPVKSIASPTKKDIGERTGDNWLQLGEGKTIEPQREQLLRYDVVVAGGGMAGISAAVASARNGAKTLLVQDRPVLGGNASSEMRVTVNSAHPERETGIVEEILIENWVHNPQESYPVWDHVLYNFVTREPNLKLMLNTQVVGTLVEGSTIKAAICWGLTTETEYTIEAKQFIDCSGDGLMAATTGALYRTGREGRDEFNESYAPEKPDGWVMGDCILMSTKDMGRPVPFKAPHYAIKFDHETAFKDKHRRIKRLKEGFWWIEVGSQFDIIAEREEIREKLMAHFYGFWDYVKNSGDFPEAANLALDWVGSIPGRRESRRFMGDYILTQNDLLGYAHFDDAVAFGGWSLDEHNPGGIENLEEPASYFHERFKKVYEVPYGCLYSKDIDNLSFAGRNVSVTHIALSSTRIIGTCAAMGQAAGTAAALCTKLGVSPRALRRDHINLLQEQLMLDDAFIPNRPSKDANNLALKAVTIIASSTLNGAPANLIDGVSRDVGDEIHFWEADGQDATVELHWEKPVELAQVILKGDTNVHRKLMMHKDPEKYAGQVLGVPPELVKNLDVDVQIMGKWQKVATVDENITRLVKVNFEKVKTTAVRIRLKESWGYENARLFEVRCYG